MSEQTKKAETYHVCHSCQLQGLRNCAEFDVCGGSKTYPNELRDSVTMWHKNNVPISVIAEKAFDLTQSDPAFIAQVVEKTLDYYREHGGKGRNVIPEIVNQIIKEIK